MFELPVAELTAWIGRYLWPFFRVGAFFMTMPIIGTQLVPVRIRLMLTIVVTLAAVPLLPVMPRVDPLSIQSYLLIGQQLMIGVAMAFVLQMLFQVFVLVGQMIAMQMGLGFASMIDPTNGVSVAIFSQFYLMLAMLLFLAMNGHLIVIEVLIESFTTMPVALTGFDFGLFHMLVNWAVWMFASALVMAMPAITALLIVNFAFGIMNRAAPQFNIFSLGFPFSMIFGLLIVYISLSGFLPQYELVVEQSLMMMREWVGAS